MEKSRDIDQKRKESPYMEISSETDQKNAHMSNKMQLQNHFSTIIHKNISILSTTSILSCSLMADNLTASFDKLTCSDYVDFGKCQDRFGQFYGSENDSNYLDKKLKVFRKDDKKEF